MAKITSYEFTFEIFKKHYCPYCGIRLERKQKNNILHKGDKGFTKNHLGVGYNPFVNENRIITHYFVCYRCNKKYNQHELCRIRKLQRKSKSKILANCNESLYKNIADQKDILGRIDD